MARKNAAEEGEGCSTGPNLGPFSTSDNQVTLSTALAMVNHQEMAVQALLPSVLLHLGCAILLHPPFLAGSTVMALSGGKGLGRLSDITKTVTKAWFPSITCPPLGRHCAWIALTQHIVPHSFLLQGCTTQHHPATVSLCFSKCRQPLSFAALPSNFMGKSLSA